MEGLEGTGNELTERRGMAPSTAPAGVCGARSCSEKRQRCRKTGGGCRSFKGQHD